MKLLSLSVVRWAIAALAFLLVLAPNIQAQAAEVKYQAILIWGSNDQTSPDPKHKEVDPKLAAKLKKLPFKWQYYYEVNRKDISVTGSEKKKVNMSKDCDLQVKIEAEIVEVKLFGKGQLVSKISQKLPKGECLVTGGNAADSTGWFVVLRQID